MADLLTPEYLEAENERFASTWEEVRSYILSQLTMCGPSISRMEKLLDYTCKGGKMTRAKTITRVVELKRRQQAEPPDDDSTHIALILGWCLEMVQAYFLVMDDIIDHSETRRFQPCWYKLPDVGPGLGIVDSVLLRSFLLKVLHHFVSAKPYYGRVMELFNECIFMTEVGEMLDTLSEHKRDINYITEDTYFNVVWHKTCYYTIHLPVALGLVVAGELDVTVTEAEVKSITFAVGEYFQIQDDILDCFADTEVIGKIGTDIQDFKCSWLAMQFLKTATPEQKTQFHENYGLDRPECIAKIKALYKEANILQAFEVLEEQYGKKVAELLPLLGQKSSVLQATMETLWKVTYKRKY